MITKPTKLTTGAALAAALTMAATPAAAVDLPYLGSSDVEVETGAAEDQNQHRRYRHRRHRDRGVDAGDVIAGVVILGAIAAIAGSGRDRDRDRDRNREVDYPERNDRRDRDERRTYDSRGLDNASEMCVDQVERGDDRVDDISSARRTADGWRVAGTLTSGEGWNCWIDNDGRIRSIDFGAADNSYEANGDYRGSASAAPAGDQWNDDAYARARAGTRTAADGEYTYRAEADYTPDTNGPQPAYPGGPLPGEEGYGEAADNDGRYTTAQAPDFPQRGN